MIVHVSLRDPTLRAQTSRAFARHGAFLSNTSAGSDLWVVDADEAPAGEQEIPWLLCVGDDEALDPIRLPSNCVDVMVTPIAERTVDRQCGLIARRHGRAAAGERARVAVRFRSGIEVLVRAFQELRDPFTTVVANVAVGLEEIRELGGAVEAIADDALSFSRRLASITAALDDARTASEQMRVVSRSAEACVSEIHARFGGCVDSAPTAIQSTAANPRRARVLMIDDEPMICAVFRRAIGREHDVTTAGNGLEALRILEHQRFDLICCDLMMPEMSGMEFHDTLAVKEPALARDIVFISGGAFTPEGRSFLDRVTNLRMDKPFDARRILALIRDRLGDAATILTPTVDSAHP